MPNLEAIRKQILDDLENDHYEWTKAELYARLAWIDQFREPFAQLAKHETNSSAYSQSS